MIAKNCANVDAVVGLGYACVGARSFWGLAHARATVSTNSSNRDTDHVSFLSLEGIESNRSATTRASYRASMRTRRFVRTRAQMKNRHSRRGSTGMRAMHYTSRLKTIVTGWNRPLAGEFWWTELMTWMRLNVCWRSGKRMIQERVEEVRSQKLEEGLRRFSKKWKRFQVGLKESNEDTKGFGITWLKLWEVQGSFKRLKEIQEDSACREIPEGSKKIQFGTRKEKFQESERGLKRRTERVRRCRMIQ